MGFGLVWFGLVWFGLKYGRLGVVECVGFVGDGKPDRLEITSQFLYVELGEVYEEEVRSKSYEKASAKVERTIRDN